MSYVTPIMLLFVIALLCGILAFMRMFWLSVKDINLEGKPVIIYKEHPKPRAGGLTKRPIKVNSDKSIWEREQDGHARSTAEIV